MDLRDVGRTRMVGSCVSVERQPGGDYRESVLRKTDDTTTPASNAKLMRLSAAEFRLGHQRQRIAFGILKVCKPDFPIGQRGDLVRLRSERDST
jgi:hypothetical protein